MLFPNMWIIFKKELMEIFQATEFEAILQKILKALCNVEHLSE